MLTNLEEREIRKLIRDETQCFRCCNDDFGLTTLSPPVADPGETGKKFLFNNETGVAYYWDGDSWESFPIAPEPSYLVYTALLSQTGTSAPTATILENTLGVTPTLVYGSPGNYSATIPGGFDEAKTLYKLQNANDAWNGSVARTSIDLEPSDGTLYFFVANSSEVGINDWGATLALEIQVYP